MKDQLIAAGLELGADVLGIAAKAIAGAFAKPEEIRAAYIAATDKFTAFLMSGGELDARRDAARAKLDAKIEDAEKSQR